MDMGLRRGSPAYLRFSVGMAVAILVVALRVNGADDNSCINAIVPCSAYLNTTTKPPNTCCDPLLKVISTQAECLCNVLNSSIITQLGINVTQALEVPARCGRNVTTDACANGTAATPPVSSAPPPSSGSNSNGSAKNAAIPTASFEILLVMAILLLGVFEFQF
uniref:TSA: Wollemia nobilis Ref_Wollemi_Transcript_6958_802 transcribed RNA sequence n=1 Tax=Wollemia nobilis TaxID=56998 RepID=A0A0C9S9Q9_9CONI